MNVLSLFNGMSFCSMALESLGVNVDKMYSSEIDKYANQATQAMFPDTIQLGDVTKWREWDIDWASIELVTGGFPCQAWSMAGKQLGDKDERGMLFWTMLDIMKHVKYHNPKVDFLIENVKMKKEFEQYITTHTENALGKVHKILINSALVSAQNRNRYYWTSFAVEQPEDKGIMLKDVIEHDTDEKYKLTDKCADRLKRYNNADKMLGDQDKSLCLVAGYHKLGRDNTYIKCDSMIGRKINTETGKRDDYNPDLKTVQYIEVRSDEKTGTLTAVQKDNYVVRATVQKNAEHTYNSKVPTLTASMGMGGGNVPLFTDQETAAKFKGMYIDKTDRLQYRKLTPKECFRLQTVPEHHIDTLLNSGISNTQLYKMCGNGWTMDVIAHILKGL